MLDINEINDTIADLETNYSTTFDTCMKLASLYTVREHLQTSVTKPTETKAASVETELNDILPQYRLYCNVKRKYQLNELTEQAVFIAMRDLCKEISEFLHILYSNTDTPKEREMIKALIADLNEAF